MNPLFDAHQLRNELVATEQKAASLKAAIQRAETECGRHKWGAIQYIPIEHPAYQTKGDPPGTMGVDWQGPCYIPASTDKRWSRTCAACGKVEITTSTRKERMAGSVPGTSGEVEVPDFMDRIWGDLGSRR